VSHRFRWRWSRVAAMCARSTLTASADEVADFFGLAHLPDLVPRYNIAPFTAPGVRPP